MTQRIRVTGGPWPERIGLEGVIVEPSPEDAKLYPFKGRGKTEVIIHLDDDPLDQRYGYVSYWTCAMDRRDIEEIR